MPQLSLHLSQNQTDNNLKLPLNVRNKAEAKYRILKTDSS